MFVGSARFLSLWECGSQFLSSEFQLKLWIFFSWTYKAFSKIEIIPLVHSHNPQSFPRHSMPSRTKSFHSKRDSIPRHQKPSNKVVRWEKAFNWMQWKSLRPEKNWEIFIEKVTKRFFKINIQKFLGDRGEERKVLIDGEAWRRS